MGDLASTQSDFWHYISGEKSIATPELLGRIQTSAQVPARQRLGIYRNMYVWRLIEALRHDFPKLAAWVGDHHFTHLATDYVRARPSHDADIGRVGEAFSEFLTTRSMVAAELAAFEWARSKVFTAAQQTPIDVAAMQAFPAERIGDVRLQFVAALTQLHAGHDVAQLWDDLEAERDPKISQPQPCAWAIWRQGYLVLHTQLAAREAASLRAAQQGNSLAQICELFADDDSPVQAAFAVIGSWFKDGWIANITL